MSTRKLSRAIDQLIREAQQLSRNMSKAVVHWLLRCLLLIGRQPLFNASGGFVLPTTVLLLLVLTLTVGSIGVRTYNRTVQTSSERQQRVIFNAATPAIDRAKAKLEFLFDAQRDRRFPSGVPAENWLLGMMYNDERVLPGNTTVPRLTISGDQDPYTFPDETRVNVAGDGLPDNAWRYRIDTDGDNAADSTVVYSVIFGTPATLADLNKPNDAAVLARANALQVRHGPLSNAGRTNSACQVTNANAIPPVEAGWFRNLSNTSILRKNFQVNVFVKPDSPTGTVSTLEFHQDREVNRGNKWGAWFRNDLEIFPGPQFNWNGAMHTEGNLFSTASSNFQGHMISSPASCLYSKEASEISVTEITEDPTQGIPAFQGQFLAGNMRDNNFAGGSAVRYHLFIQGQNPDTGNNSIYNNSTDSVRNNSPSPADFALDPVRLQTEDISIARGVANPTSERIATWEAGQFREKGRMKNLKQTAPYVDDIFRADNRYGPKPRYKDRIPGVIGETIGNRPELVGNDPPPGGESTNIGLDGYWERRARREGMRIVVGQRLDLGDHAGWGGPLGPNLREEPLRPWRRCTRSPDANNSTICNEARQRRTLWDNLASVQGTVLYHSGNGAGTYDRPIACLATTVHPGTAGTLTNSSTFENLVWNDPTQMPDAGANPGRVPYSVRVGSAQYGGVNTPMRTNFFRGEGTNGWEFAAPSEADFQNASSPIMQALRNLAYLAGDPLGGAPSFTPVQDRNVHPYPALAQFGDFSMLRRVISELDANGYANLSPADKTTLHTAGCTMGMLAFDIAFLENFGVDSANPANRIPLVDAPLSANPLGIDASTYLLHRLIGYANVNPNGTPGGLARTSREYNMGLRGKIRRIFDGDPYVAAPGPGGYSQGSPLGRIFNPNLTRTHLGLELSDYAAPNIDNPDYLIRLLEQWRDWLVNQSPAPTEEIAEINMEIRLAKLIMTKEQVARDRIWGFLPGQYGYAPVGLCQIFDGQLFSPSATALSTSLTDRNFSRTAVRDSETPTNRTEPLQTLCSRRPRYPVLYNLFPVVDNIAPFATTSPTAGLQAPSPNPTIPDPGLTALVPNYAALETHTEVIDVSRDGEDSFDPYIGTSNQGLTYAVVNPTELALIPLERTSWQMPNEVVPAPVADADTPNRNDDTLVLVCNQPCSRQTSGYFPPTTLPSGYNTPDNRYFLRVAFKDTAPYNGRELMSVRALDMNLELMRRSTGPGGDFWLPRSGVIYAFREDAVSENEIVRPTRGDWSSCRTNAGILSGSCQMTTGNVTAFLSTDPPLNENNNISPKPVDYFADPDRRPYGFRVKRGADLRRVGDEGRGLSLISDNPVYIQGDFNLHQATSGNTRLEEFTSLLPDNYTPAQFYGRTQLDTRFARAAEDRWRPSEIIADAISILSDNFCDGSIEDGLVTTGITGSGTSPSLPFNMGTRTITVADYGCQTSNGRTSYMNQNRPNQNPNSASPNPNRVFWLRSNLSDSYSVDPNDPNAALRGIRTEGTSPIFINRDANPVVSSLNPTNSRPYTGGYYPMNSPKPLVAARCGTRVNSIIVSGIVPSRAGSSYGGMHNFPRFLENWGCPLYISGSFLQLNFSTYATGPFDQDAFEVGATPVPGAGGNELIQYYSPPNRFWGYDVGLQYAPAGPVAQRFVTAEAVRSEFYSEPAANDPYIHNLCRTITGANCPPPTPIN